MNVGLQGIQDIVKLEGEIAKAISPYILDYVFILAPEINNNVTVKRITPDVEKLLIDYISKGTAFLDNYGIQFRKDADILTTTINLMREIYLIKYMSAVTVYNEYELTRIPTFFESELSIKSRNRFKLPENTISFIIQDAFVIDENTGLIDWKATMQKENTEHVIGSYISSFKTARRLVLDFNDQMYHLSTRALTYKVFSDELIVLTEDVLITVMNTIAKEVYVYLDRNYSLEDSISNVYVYYGNLLVEGNNNFMGKNSKLFNAVTSMIIQYLSQFKELKPETIDVILDDYYEVIIENIRTRNIFPLEYYKVQHRQTNQLHQHEKGYNYSDIIDLFTYIPEGGVTDMAMESFSAELSTPAKIFIFEHLTNGNVNPLFTLDDYLRTDGTK